MKHLEHGEPLNAILHAAGWQGTANVVPTEVEFASTIRTALTQIGTATDSLDQFQQLVANALFKHTFRLPSAGSRIKPAEILSALAKIERGLHEIEQGLNVLEVARCTADVGGTDRADNLQNVQWMALGAIADALFSALPQSIRPTDDQLAEAMPEYTRFSKSRSWRGLFSIAAKRVRAGKEAYTKDDFHLPTKPADSVMDELIGDLAGIFREVTGKTPTSPNASGNVPCGWRSAFSQFVANLWPLVTGNGNCAPTNKKIRAALRRSDLLPTPYPMK